MDEIIIQIDAIIAAGGPEAEIQEFVREERQQWLDDLSALRDYLIKNHIYADTHLKYLNREIYLMRRRLGIPQTREEMKLAVRLRNKRANDRRKAIISQTILR